MEGIYPKTGRLVPLDKLLALKKKYKFRAILDDSMAVGVLGATGRGTAEHHGVPITEVDMVTVNLGNALGSIGAMVLGSHKAMDHQRLNGAGYVFSASLPPFLASAAIKALDRLDEEPQLVEQLQLNVTDFRKALAAHGGDALDIGGCDESALVVVRLAVPADEAAEECVVRRAVELCQHEHGVLVATWRGTKLDRQQPRPALRACVSAAHSREQLEAAAAAVAGAMRKAGQEEGLM